MIIKLTFALLSAALFIGQTTASEIPSNEKTHKLYNQLAYDNLLERYSKKLEACSISARKRPAPPLALIEKLSKLSGEQITAFISYKYTRAMNLCMAGEAIDFLFYLHAIDLAEDTGSQLKAQAKLMKELIISEDDWARYRTYQQIPKNIIEDISKHGYFDKEFNLITVSTVLGDYRRKNHRTEQNQ